MGPDLVIVNLTMTEEATRRRISKRHSENQSITEMLMVNEIKIAILRIYTMQCAMQAKKQRSS